MTTIDEDLRAWFSAPTEWPPIDGYALVARGRRARRARRRTRLPVATVLVVIASVALVARPAARVPQGHALTLTSASSLAVVATARGHVDFAGGLEVWRSGSELFAGYPGQSWASVDTRHPDGAGGRDGLGIFEDRGVVSSVVHATPRTVTVTLSGERRVAQIACFEQTPGWCVWVAAFDRPLTRAETRSLSADPPAHLAFTG